MLKAFKYRIYPTLDQATMIDKTVGVCRFIYNLALETKIRAYNDAGIILTVYDLQKQFTPLRHEIDWIKEVGYEAPAEAINGIGAAYKSLKNGGGYPKFKSKRKGGCFVVRTGEKRINFETQILSAGLIKNVNIKVSREFTGEIRQIFISRTNTNKYYASFLVQDEVIEPVAQTPKNAIGIDLGIKDFAVLSTGEKIANPRLLQSEMKRLKTLQRRVSKKVNGSNNKKKASLKVALLHEKIANQRNDFLHKLSSRLIGDSQTDTICLETLSVKSMIKNHNLAQAIGDSSWGEFVRQLEYKGKWYGKNVIRIGMFYPSSKTCSNCGDKYDNLKLLEREWQCAGCNTTHDRDINAANNIKNIGMSGVGSPVEPVELLAIAGAKKQESIPTLWTRF